MTVSFSSTFFFDFKMRICHRRDLRQMGDADDLMALPDLCHFFGNLLRRPSADSGVDFIENQSFCLVAVGKNRLDCKHDSRQFTAGNNFRQRTDRFARFVEIKNSTASVPFSV
mgnify:CR=1 FL=1